MALKILAVVLLGTLLAGCNRAGQAVGCNAWDTRCTYRGYVGDETALAWRYAEPLPLGDYPNLPGPLPGYMSRDVYVDAYGNHRPGYMACHELGLCGRARGW